MSNYNGTQLLEADPSVNYERAVKEFALEMTSNGRFVFAFTSKGSPVYLLLKEIEGLRLFILSESSYPKPSGGSLEVMVPRNDYGVLLNIIDEQAVKTIIQYAVADVGKFLAEHVDPFLRTEQETIFLWVVDDRDDDFIDDLQTTANNVDVPVGGWVERPRINRPAVHTASSP